MTHLRDASPHRGDADTVTVSLRVPIDLWVALERKAALEGRSRNAQVLHAIKENTL
jgi:hypothetical protein